MRWLCLILTFTAACAPATRGLAPLVSAPTVELTSAEPPAETRVTSLPRRSARLAPPFAGTTSTRRIDEAGTPSAATQAPARLELAAAH